MSIIKPEGESNVMAEGPRELTVFSWSDGFCSVTVKVSLE